MDKSRPDSRPRARLIEARNERKMSQKEVARHLRVRETTIEKHVSRAVRLLAQFMLAGNNRGDAPLRPEIEAEDHAHDTR